jgi:subfamily B ATP-binding cassette protein MsbA
MIQFLLKIFDLARPYRARLLLGVLTGIISGLIEPLMIATVVFVYGLMFPSATSTTSLLSPDDFRHPATLVTRLRDHSDPVSNFLWNQFSDPQRQSLAESAASSDLPPAVLVEKLNRLVQCDTLYESQRFAGVNLSPATRLLLAENPQGEKLIRLNRMLLEDAFPTEIRREASSSFSSQLQWAPHAVQQWAATAEHALATGVRSHRWAILLMTALIPIVLFLRSFFSYINTYFLQWVAIRSITDLRIRLFDHLMNLSAGFFNRTTTGELMSRIMNDTNSLQNVITGSTAVMIKDPVTVLSLLAYVLWKEPKLTLISLLILPVSMIPIVIYGRKVRRSSKALQNHSAELGEVMSESFSGNRVIKAYNLEQRVVEQFRATASKFIGHFMRIVRSSELPGPLLEFVGSIGLSLVLIYLAFEGAARPTSTDFLRVILSLFAMYRPLKNLTRLHNNLEQARAASGRVFELLATTNDIPEPPDPKPLKAAGAPIHFDDIYFSYDDKPVLHGINLTVQPGRLVALVGASGSGKTTMTNLLLRFYDPQRGAVRIGDTDIRDVATRDLRQQIAVVAQETILFNETILRNIELGRPSASRDEIIQAAKHAHAQDFILEKPDSFDTVIGEKGIMLSGGQRQRLAIARAILKNAPILVLDEATSSLDTESERAVQAALEDLMQGRTTLCIAHRLSTIQKADLIVVLDSGRIVETGTHSELMQARGAYCRLYELQFKPQAGA